MLRRRALDRVGTSRVGRKNVGGLLVGCGEATSGTMSCVNPRIGSTSEGDSEEMVLSRSRSKVWWVSATQDTLLVLSSRLKVSLEWGGGGFRLDRTRTCCCWCRSRWACLSGWMLLLSSAKKTQNDHAPSGWRRVTSSLSNVLRLGIVVAYSVGQHNSTNLLVPEP